jgi:hypothetical protein
VTIIEISCEEVWQELSNYIDNDLPEELRTRMDAHFRKCKHCTAIYDGTRNVIQLVGDFQAFDIPRGFSQRLKARIYSTIRTD